MGKLNLLAGLCWAAVILFVNNAAALETGVTNKQSLREMVQEKLQSVNLGVTVTNVGKNMVATITALSTCVSLDQMLNLCGPYAAGANTSETLTLVSCNSHWKPQFTINSPTQLNSWCYFSTDVSFSNSTGRWDGNITRMVPVSNNNGHCSVTVSGTATGITFSINATGSDAVNPS